jgi:hypothetical protein
MAKAKESSVVLIVLSKTCQSKLQEQQGSQEEDFIDEKMKANFSNDNLYESEAVVDIPSDQ